MKKKLKECQGTGRHTCDQCHGMRMLPQIMNGQIQQIPCGGCRGGGIVSCFRCSGDGGATCNVCNGVQWLKWYLQVNVN